MFFKKNKMKERLLKNWTLTRAIYLVLGSFIIIQSLMNDQWIGAAFGGYFAAMGLFAFGCAAGNCGGSSCAVKPHQKSITTMDVTDKIKG